MGLARHPTAELRGNSLTKKTLGFFPRNDGDRTNPSSLSFISSHRQAAKVIALSRRSHGFKSRWEYHMRAWCNGSHAALRTPCRKACRFKSCRSHQIPFTLSVEAMSFTFIPRFNYPELPNNSLRLCRICRSVGMVDKEVSKTFAETRVGSSPIFGTKGAHSNISFEEYLKFIG